MTDTITVWQLRDIASNENIFVPDSEDFQYWHGDAVLDANNSVVEVCYEGCYGQLNNLSIGDTIQIYDGHYYWPCNVVGKLELRDPVVREGHKMVDPVEIDLEPPHNEDEIPTFPEIDDTVR